MLKTLFDLLAILQPLIPIALAVSKECDCRDWYGSCRLAGAEWVDDSSWSYRCDMKQMARKATFIGCISGARNKNQLIPVGSNITVDGFWYSCEADEMRLKYQQEPQCIVNDTKRHVGERFRDGRFHWLCLETGRWITGCYYQNETQHWNLLNIGETAYNGLVRHTCEKHSDNPGRIQYYAKIRDDVPFKQLPDKGTNQNLPEPGDFRLTEDPIKWLHEKATTFIANKPYDFNTKIRFLSV